MACFQAALQIRTVDSSPNKWGATQLYLGVTYGARLEGERKENLEQAMACYQAALEVYTRYAFPDEHRIIQLNRVTAEGKLQNWESVHAACTEALAAEDALIRLGAGAVGHDLILKEGSDTASYDGFALTRLGRVQEAAVVIENRRAHGLSQMLTLDAGSAEEIQDTKHRTRYKDAQRTFIKAQAILNDPISRGLSENERRRIILERTEAYHRATEMLEAVITEIRAAQDPPHFLENALSTATILHAAESGGNGHALVYLVATPWGGMAVAVLNTGLHQDAPARFTALDLPRLSDDLVRSLFETKLGYTSRIIGGYIHAQEGNGWTWLRKQWPGETFRQSVESLHAACTAAHQMSTLAAATQKMLEASTLAHLVDQPFDQLAPSELARLRNTLGHLFLQLELQRCLKILAAACMLNKDT